MSELVSLLAKAPQRAVTNADRLDPGEQASLSPNGFKWWIHYACVEWPPYLLIKGSQANDAIQKLRGSDPAAITDFGVAYARWWSLSEQAKDSLMTWEQRSSLRRSYYLEQARLRCGL